MSVALVHDHGDRPCRQAVAAASDEQGPLSDGRRGRGALGAGPRTKRVKYLYQEAFVRSLDRFVEPVRTCVERRCEPLPTALVPGWIVVGVRLSSRRLQVFCGVRRFAGDGESR